MADLTKKETFPATARQPGFLSVWDAETFIQAGLEPLDVLKARLQTYEAVRAEANTLRGLFDSAQWGTVLLKAKLGGLITLGKQMTKGAKANVAKDFGLSEDTANRYERLYKFLPWGWQPICEQAMRAEQAGRDYQYSIDGIIAEGERRAIAAGATVFRPKLTGTGKCLLIDPAAQTMETQDLPSSFSASKAQRVHWRELDSHEARLRFASLAGNRQKWIRPRPQVSGDWRSGGQSATPAHCAHHQEK